MKKIFTLIMLGLISLTIQAQNPDVLIDKTIVQSPYWGLKFESGTVTDASMNCGSSNTNFVVGDQYLLARFPINLANMGTSVAYFGTYGQNGITHDLCYDPQFTNATDFINIPNFVTAYLLDSCNNVINWNRKTDWNIQNNSQYAVSVYNGQTTYLTQTFGLPPTTGTDPNPLKDWLEPLCGALDPNLAIAGRAQMDAYYNDCQVCDSLVLFPNYTSNDYGVIQLPTNLSPGSYYLVLAGNFSMLNQGTNCYPDSIVLPFTWDGSTGVSSTFPYPVNGVTHLSTGFAPCVQLSIPSAPTQVTAGLLSNGNLNNSNRGTQWIEVSWNTTDNLASRFVVTPYVVLTANSEKAVTTLAKTVTSSPVIFTSTDIRNSQEILGVAGVDKNNLKVRFKVKAVNAAGESTEVSSGNPAVSIK